MAISNFKNVIVSFNGMNPVYLENGEDASSEFKIIAKALRLKPLKLDIDMESISSRLKELFNELKEVQYDLVNMINDEPDSDGVNCGLYKSPLGSVLEKYHDLAKDLRINIATHDEIMLGQNTLDLNHNILLDVLKAESLSDIKRTVDIVINVIKLLCSNCDPYKDCSYYQYFIHCCEYIKQQLEK